MSRTSKVEYLERIQGRYLKASREEKCRILNEFCRVTKYHRKYAVRLLNGPAPPSRPRPRCRRPTYSPAALRALVIIWRAAGYPWSVRLKALLPTWVPKLRRRLRLSAALERQLLTISARQIDRRLQGHKRRLKKRLYGRTKPGTLLKHHIPLRTDAWNVTQPGYTEVDLVAHCGNCADGEFIHTLNLTDILTTWGESRAVMGRAQIRVQKALDDIRLGLPFTLRGIDSDNGSEFINNNLLAYCRAHDIQFTRGRPYKKNDNAHIEQKNWTHVRKLLGYARFDTPETLKAINALYRNELRLFHNLFLPSVKLVRKTRVGSRVRRYYDRPQTPLERLQASGQANRRVLAELRRLRDRLDPFALSEAIDQQLEHIQEMASRRHGPPPARRPVAGRDHPWRWSYKRRPGVSPTSIYCS